MTKHILVFLLLSLVGIYTMYELWFGTRHWVDALISIVTLTLSVVIYERFIK